MAKQNLAIQILIDAKDRASSAISSVSKSVAAFGAAVTAAGAALLTWAGTKLIGDSARAAEDLERQMAKLQGAIEATGGAAGLTAQEIAEMADRLDEATLGTDDQFRDAAAALLTFKSVGKDVFETVLERAQDLADTGFGSMQSNAVMLGKALEDPARGLTALTRAGVTFTDSQRQVIDALQRSGDTAGAQAVILEAVAGQVGGVARAMGGGLSGAVDLVAKRFNDLKETLGAALVPVLTSINQRIADLFKRMTDSGAVAKLGEAIATMASQAAAAVEDLIRRADFTGLANRIGEFASQTTQHLRAWGESVTLVGDGVTRIFQGVLAVFRSVQQAVELVTAGVTGTVSLAMRGVATLYEGLAKLGLVSEETALKWRAAQETMAQATTDLVARANQHWAEAKDAAGAALGLIEEKSQTAAAAVQTLDTTMGLTTAQFEALGEGASYAAEGERALADATGAAATASQGATGATQQETEARRLAAQALIAQTQAQIDLIARQKEELDAATQRVTMVQQEGELRRTHIANLIAEAQARGALATAERLSAQEARISLQVAREARDAAAAEAAASEALAQSLRAQAAAQKDVSEETRQGVRDAEAAAVAKRAAATAAQEAYRHERAMQQATAELAESQRVLSQVMREAGVQGVSSMEDVQRAIASTNSSGELEALGDALREAFAKGVLGAEEYQAALEQVRGKMEQVRETTRGVRVDYEELWRTNNVGGRVPEEVLAGRNLPTEMRQRIISQYREWEDEFLLQQRENEARRREREQALDKNKVAEQAAAGSRATRTVRVEIVSGGKTTPIDVAAGQEDDLLEALRRAGLSAA